MDEREKEERVERYLDEAAEGVRWGRLEEAMIWVRMAEVAVQVGRPVYMPTERGPGPVLFRGPDPPLSPNTC